jgi:cell division protein FtsB
LARWWPIPLLWFGALLIAALDGNVGLHAWWQVRDTLREAELERAALRREVADLRAAASALESDPFAIERAIRERLRFAKPDETLVHLPEPKGASSRIP